MYVTYTARRRLISGHSAGIDYSLTFDAQQYDTELVPKVAQSIAIDGTTQTDFKRLDEVYDIDTDLFASSLVDDWLEFLASVAGGETFTFDATSSNPAAPGTPLSVIIEGTRSIKPKRVSNAWWQVSFKVRVLP